MSIEKVYGTEVIVEATILAKQGRCPRNLFAFPIDPEATNQRDALGIEELARELANRAGVAGFEHSDKVSVLIDPDVDLLMASFPGSVLLS